MLSHRRLDIALFHALFLSDLHVALSKNSCRGLCVNGLSKESLDVKNHELTNSPCLCNEGFTGKFCETPLSCFNGASRDKNGSCQCQEHFTGTYCEKIDCGDGIPASEVQYAVPGVRCLCNAGVTGAFCETSTSSVCGDHGRFLNQGCQCDTNYYGPYCDQRRECLNGVDNGEKCECDTGWRGRHCDTITCKFGHEVNDSSACECAPGIGGKFCDVCEDFFEEPPDCGRMAAKQQITRNLVLSASFTVMLIIVCLGVARLILKGRRFKKHSGIRMSVKKAQQNHVPIGDDTALIPQTVEGIQAQLLTLKRRLANYHPPSS